MAGLQITPGSTGNPIPSATTTRTSVSADAAAVSSSTVRTTGADSAAAGSGESSAVDRAIADSRKRAQEQDTREAQQRRQEETLENVVSRSSDGDTVQVSDEGAEELIESTEGAVVSMEQSAAGETESRISEEDITIEPVEAPEITPIEPPEITPVEESEVAPTAEAEAALTAEEDEDAASSVVTSFTGYTDQQVEQMYLEGEITQNEYNTEIARREEAREADSERGRQVNEDMRRLGEADSRTRMADFAIDTAVNSGNDRISLDDRLQAVDSVFEDRRDAVRREQEAGRLWDYQLQV